MTEPGQDPSIQKQVEVVPISAPPSDQCVGRGARFAADGEKKTRYSLPTALQSASPVGYRKRVSMTRDEAESIMPLLSLERPSDFSTASAKITEAELFEETSLGILSSRQSTNYRGHKQVTLGPRESEVVSKIMDRVSGKNGPSLHGATHTHLVFSKPYRTPFTLLLTFIGHKPVKSLLGVPKRALEKRLFHKDDIPTVGYLQQLHIGILADGMERAALIASQGKRRANVHMAPFCGRHQRANKEHIRELEKLGGLTPAERQAGWRLAIVCQVGEVAKEEQMDLPEQTWRKLGANLLSLRSERIQPGVNQEEKAPDSYQHRQDMDVPDELTVMCGRAAYNAFVHWIGCGREHSKELLLLERIDVLTPNGKQRLRDVRDMLGQVTESVMGNLPLWADLPTGKALSRNAARGKKAFALAGQRIYVGGLDRTQLEKDGIDWDMGVRAFGAAAARSSLVAELMGCVDIPEGCDLLAGMCLMAGPVNQNDIGKEFYHQQDILADEFPGQDPTSLLVWTLKAKTVADPIGNEEQLMNPARKGALVDLRPGPHEVVSVKRAGRLEPMRKRGRRVNTERAFSDVDNFVTDPDGQPIPGNRGSRWPEAWRNETIW